MFTLETNRISLMPWRYVDFAAFRPIATDPQVMRYINNGAPWNDEQIREFIRLQMRHAASKGFCLWRIVRRHDGKLLGFCGLQPLTIEGWREVEIGWWLAVNCWRRGLATEAAHPAMQFAFDRANLGRVIAIAQPENRASVRIMRKLGMKFDREATHKGIRVVLYEMNRQPRS
jgi:ribosomal-protein-alanine N-acetyltransferase